MIDGVTTTSPAPPDVSTAAVKGGPLGKQEFLQLLVTQLRHQDPLNPADPQEFAAQLAQFSTLEQMINIGEQLERSAQVDQTLIQMINGQSALALIGKNIVAEGDQVTVPASGDVSVQVSVGGTGGDAVVRMYDAAGNEVGSMPLGQLPAGRQTLDLSALTGTLAPGSYSYVLEVTDAQGVAVESKTYSVSRVDGVQYTPNGPVLMSGPETIALSAVVEITG
ncbi:MAG: flagellar hook assembly protein FlgD [Longimicrobiales bacterium]